MRRNGLARRFPRGLRAVAGVEGSPRNLGGPAGSAGYKSGMVTRRSTTRLAHVGRPTLRGSERRDATAVPPSRGNERGGMGRGESECFQMYR